MAEYETKEVYFTEYCKKCIFKDTDEVEEPCNECLTQGWNEHSHKPIKFKEDKR